MAEREHHYEVDLEWTGNTGTGTSAYRNYERSYRLGAQGTPAILGSSDPIFRGDGSRWNPEQLLVAALSSCHMLSYLHLCAEAGVVVIGYRDLAEGFMTESAAPGGRFRRVVLRPVVTIAAASNAETARELHHTAHEKCFIANSVNFPVECEPEVITGPSDRSLVDSAP